MRTGAALLALVALAGTASADDGAETADTVASTWSGGALRLAEDDKRFVFALTTLAKGVRARASVSAPLDPDTRTATFVAKSGIVPAFRASGYIGYDSTFQALALDASDQGLLAYCESVKLEPCTASKAAEHKKKNGQPLGAGGLYWGAGLELSFAYDRTTAYLDDIGAGPRADFSATDLQLGGSGTIYMPGGWTLTARAGYERTNAVNIGKFRRCMSLPSSEPSITGQVCSDERYLKSDPGAEHAGYARLSGSLYPTGSPLARYIAASELRLNLEDLSTQAASFDVHLLLFANGFDLRGGSVRVGIGATVRTALRSPSGATYGLGDIYDYSLFGIAGTSF